MDNVQQQIVVLAQINQLKEMQIFCVKKELELTLLQFNTSINLKNSFQFKPKKILRTKSLD